MKNTRFNLHAIVLILILALFLSGCQITPTPSKPVNPPSGPLQPTLSAVPTLAQPTAEPLIKSTAQGYVLFDKKASEFLVYNMDHSLAFKTQAPGIQFPSVYSTRPVKEAVYYMTDQPKQVFRSSPKGVEVMKVPSTNLYSFNVSLDEKHLAWSTIDPQKGVSTLWIANQDGSGEKQIAEYSAQQSPAFLLMPLEWTADGELLFERTLTGLGGYILFGGHNSLYRYNAESGQITTIIPAAPQNGICLDTYRLDLNKVVYNCGSQGSAMIIRDLKTQDQTQLPNFEGQNVNGSARFSPSGKWMAYATAAGNPDNENGQVVIVPTDLSTAAAPIAKIGNNSFAYVQGWLDDQTIVFTRFAGVDSTLWTVQRDGSGASQIGQGLWVGWIN